MLGSSGGPAPRGPAPLEAALDVELHRFVRVTIRLWQLVGAVGVIASLAAMYTVSYNLGVACAVTSGVYLAWFVPMGWRMERGAVSPAAQAAADGVEATVPWTFFAVMAFAQGADYALASWVPPMLFSMLIFNQALRLRVRAPLVVGIAGSIAFPLLYFLLVRSRLSDEVATRVVFQPSTQLTRAASLLIIGFIASLGARFLRDAIARAGKAVREQELFGKYRLLRKVARGGMGEVFEALYCPEGGFERRVAVKRIHAHLVEQERFVTLFRTEAELCSRLAHPNIVQVMDFGKVGESYFLAMEYVDGITLAGFVKGCHDRRTPVSEPVAGTIIRDLLAGLHHAHELARGADGKPLRVIHRDLCPQNVLLSRNGEVKISDFGVARALKDAESSHTRTIVGHSAYMAPEQAMAESFDHRTDLFAVGVVLWEMLVGRRLFHRESDAATVHALIYEEINAPGTIRAGIDPGWDPFVMQALAREPANRFQSALEMSAALDAIASSRDEGASRELAQLVGELADEQEDARAARDEASTVVEGSGEARARHADTG